MISKFDKKLYVKKLDGRYYKVKVKVMMLNPNSRKSMAMGHRQKGALYGKREFESVGYLTDESDYELVDNKGDEDDVMGKEVKEKIDLHKRISRNWAAEFGKRDEWDDCAI